MDPRILDRLRCPVCGEPLTEATAGTTSALRCPRRHSFDIARQGYVNLLTGRAPHVGDTAEMVAARADFQAAGHYDVISAALVDAATEAVGRFRATPTPDVGAYPLVVDAGAGTGRYLGAVLAALPDAVGLALDVSKPALRRAARAHPRAAAALADTWQRLPLADASTAVLLNVFAPETAPSSTGCSIRPGRCWWSRPTPTISPSWWMPSTCCGWTRTRPTGWPTAWAGTSRWSARPGTARSWR